MNTIDLIDGPLYQWDTGRKIELRDTEIDEIHISTKKSQNALVVFPYSENGVTVADIPNILLQDGNSINVYAVVYHENGERTIYDRTFGIHTRSKPDDYIYYETEVLTYKLLEDRIKILENNSVNTPVKSVNGQTGEVELTANDVGALSQTELQAGVDTALAQAKASGAFDGVPGKDGVDGRDGTDGKDGAPGADGNDGITPTIGDNGNWYLGDTDTGKPSRGETGPAGKDGSDGADGKDGADGHPGADGKSAYQYAVDGGYTGTEAEFTAKMAADYIQAPLAAAVGQTIVVKAVDEDGKPAEWETVDVPSGGGSDGWTEIGEITLEGTEFIISAYSDGVVTITPENGVYPPVNKSTVLRKPDYSAYTNVQFIATGTEGQYTMKNLDGAVYAPSDDMTKYVVDVPSADSISFSNIPEFSHLKAKVTTPLLSAHGIRQTLSTSYTPFNLVGSDCAYLSGGAAEVVLETEDSPIAGKIYGKGSFKGKSASRSNGYDIIRMFDRPTAPTNIKFAHYNGLLTIGTKVKLWGRN